MELWAVTLQLPIREVEAYVAHLKKTTSQTNKVAAVGQNGSLGQAGTGDDEAALNTPIEHTSASTPTVHQDSAASRKLVRQGAPLQHAQAVNALRALRTPESILRQLPTPATSASPDCTQSISQFPTSKHHDADGRNEHDTRGRLVVSESDNPAKFHWDDSETLAFGVAMKRKRHAVTDPKDTNGGSLIAIPTASPNPESELVRDYSPAQAGHPRQNAIKTTHISAAMPNNVTGHSNTVHEDQTIQSAPMIGSPNKRRRLGSSINSEVRNGNGRKSIHEEIGVGEYIDVDADVGVKRSDLDKGQGDVIFSQEIPSPLNEATMVQKLNKDAVCDHLIQVTFQELTTGCLGDFRVDQSSFSKSSVR